MTFWRVLRDRPDELERVCSLTPHSRAERALAQEISSDLDELEVARRVFVALTQGRSGSLTRTGWRHDLRPVSTRCPWFSRGMRDRWGRCQADSRCEFGVQARRGACGGVWG